MKSSNAVRSICGILGLGFKYVDFFVQILFFSAKPRTQDRSTDFFAFDLEI